MITSSSNAQIRQIVKLNKNARERKKTGYFLVEGIRMFQEIPKELLVKAYATEDFYDAHPQLFVDRDYELVSDQVFKSMSDTMTPQGVLCIVRQLAWGLDDILCPHSAEGEVEPPFILALENIQDPGNLGTMFRTAEAAGVSGIVMSRDTVDVYNSKVVRSTMGSVFRVPFVYVEDIVETAKRMGEAGLSTYGAHLQGQDFYKEDFCRGTVFFIGNEGNGLTDTLSSVLTGKLRIPMKGKVESLNAAVAATVLMYETLRQRS